MRKSMRFVCLVFGCVGLLFGFGGCISVPFEVAGDLIETTGSVVESVVEVPFDTVGAVVHMPACFKASITEEQDFTLNENEIARIKLVNQNGSVIVRGTERQGVLVHTKKTIYARSDSAASELASELKIHTDLRDGILDIYTVPKCMPEKKCCEIIRYEIEAPFHLDLDIQADNSPVEISNIEGDIRVNSQNGRISLEDCSGGIYACTHNGEIVANIDRAWNRLELISHNGSLNATLRRLTADVHLETYNGGVELRIPEDISGKLDAQTHNGGLNSEIPVRVRNPREHQLIGELGDGDGSEIKVVSHNGSIRIMAIPSDINNHR